MERAVPHGDEATVRGGLAGRVWKGDVPLLGKKVAKAKGTFCMPNINVHAII